MSWHLATSEAVLLGLVLLLALNQVAVRVPFVTQRAWAFWGITALSGVAGLLVLVLGLPGFEHVPPVRFMVGLLFLLHVAQNLKLRADRDAAERERRREEILAERRRLQEEREEEE